VFVRLQEAFVFATPVRAAVVIWAAWWLSWMIASAWSARTRSRLSFGQEVLHLAPTIAGMAMLFRSASFAAGAPGRIHPLYGLLPAAGWAVVGLCLAGFAFAWWARLHLGSLWSASVQQKEGHRIVDTGPYGVVRHPIYTGMLTAALALAVETATLAGFAGVLLIAVGFTLKASMEERFLGEALGADAYAAYRARTPMLLPFAPF
jgi:protein-S-isoprenylcysteine O-methyltransferase Ste14